MPTLLGKSNAQKKREYIYFEFPEKGGQVAVRMSNWKGLKSNMRKDKNAPWEIYNMATDENETTNVATQHPELAQKFEAILKKEHRNSHIKEWEFVDPKFSEKE